MKIDTNKKLTQEYLKEILEYNKNTGHFYWTDCPENKVRGRSKFIKNKIPAGFVSTPHGYIKIKINKKIYQISRLAFLYMEGYIPENLVDHINCIKTDNRWSNLRHSSHSCNIRNRITSNNKSTGITGVSVYKKNGVPKNRYVSNIRENGKNLALGYFKTKDEAVIARYNAEIKHGNGCYNNSLAKKYVEENNLI